MRIIDVDTGYFINGIYYEWKLVFDWQTKTMMFKLRNPLVYM